MRVARDFWQFIFLPPEEYAMQRLYQIYDRVAKSVVGSAFTARHDGPAVREFYDALKSERSSMSAHPGDFDLLCIGSQDDTTGVLVVDGFPMVVVTGEEWVVTQERERRAQLSLVPENK